MNGHLLYGSERAALAGAVAIGRADPTERLEVSVLVRRNNGQALKEEVDELASTPSRERVHLTRSEFASRYGARADDVGAVRAFAHAHGLVVVAEYPERRTLILSGTVAQFEEAFEVELHRYEHPGGTYRGRTGALYIPAELSDVIEAVLGLDNRPQARAQFRRSVTEAAEAQAKAAVSYTPLEVAEYYQFPAGSGAGECIGIIELGGGFRPADLETYFTGLGLKTPTVLAVSVDQAKNLPSGGADGPDGEVMLDIEVSGSVAPGARIVVYFAPNTDAGFVDAVTTAAHDTSNRPSVLSISWGSAESTWTKQTSNALDAAFQAAIAMGITVCTAAGDNGSSDGVAGSASHVDFPSSSPHVLACGGTSLRVAGTSIASEVVWDDGTQGGAGGGGVSTLFALPTWQKGLHARSKSGKASALTMRGVPDVSGDADPETGYQVRVDGNNLVIGGTSAVAPLWAGLIARLNASRGAALGFVNPLLYAAPTSCRDITKGNNGAFEASPGWDACTGLGSPNGPKLEGL